MVPMTYPPPKNYMVSMKTHVSASERDSQGASTNVARRVRGPSGDDPIPRILEGMRVRASGGPDMAIESCLHYLRLLGASVTRDGGAGTEPGRITLGPSIDGPERGGSAALMAGDSSDVHCAISWLGSGTAADSRSGSETLVQALSGMMDMHGRVHGRPVRLGVELCSYAAGLLGAQWLLAGLLAGGGSEPSGETSVLQAALLFMSHYAAFSSFEGGGNEPRSEADADGLRAPPFQTRDGYAVEIETLDSAAWRRFWVSLEVDVELVKRSWDPFRLRYCTGDCRLPVTFWNTIACKTLAELVPLIEAAGVALCRVRHHDEQHLEIGPDGPVRPWSVGLEEAWEGDLSSWPPWPSLRRMGQRRSRALPLQGFKVIEMTHLVQGPLAGFLLRSLGAEIIHVTPPGGLMLHESHPREVTSFSMTYNRNKEFREIDLKTSAGRAAFLDLMSDADVVLHNWRDETATRLGVDYEALARRNPRLVYTHARGWGDRWPAAPWLATDALVQAHAGFGTLVNGGQMSPAPSRVAFSDSLGGIQTSLGILAALCLRERRQGRGCRVNTSLYDAALSFHAQAVARAGNGAGTDDAWTRLSEHPIETSDGFLAVALASHEDLAVLCRVCAVELEGRDGADIESELRAGFARRPAAEWTEALAAAGLSVAPVYTRPCALAAHPRFAHLFERERSSWVPRGPWRPQPADAGHRPEA